MTKRCAVCRQLWPDPDTRICVTCWRVAYDVARREREAENQPDK